MPAASRARSPMRAPATATTTGVGDGTGVIAAGQGRRAGLRHGAALRVRRATSRIRDAAIQAAERAGRARFAPGNCDAVPVAVPGRRGRRALIKRAIHSARHLSHRVVRRVDRVFSCRPDTAAYRTARQTAWTWLMTYPMAKQCLGQLLRRRGDPESGLGNLNQLNPLMVARYVLEHPETRPLVGGSTFGGSSRGSTTHVPRCCLRCQHHQGADCVRLSDGKPHLAVRLGERAAVRRRRAICVAKEKAYRRVQLGHLHGSARTAW